MKMLYSILLMSLPQIYSQNFIDDRPLSLGKLEIEVIAPVVEEKSELEVTPDFILNRYMNKKEVIHFKPSFRYRVQSQWFKLNKDDKFKLRLEEELEGMDDSQKFANLQRYMTSPIPVNEMCIVLTKVSDMYAEIGDNDEALQYIRVAHKIKPNDRSLRKKYKKLDDIVNPKASIIEKIRLFNQKNSVFMNVSLGIEHATNVIQEAINAAVPTNKEDNMLSTTFMGVKSWKAKPGDLSHETRLMLSNNQYESHAELNLLNSSLEHSFNLVGKHKNDDINLGFKLGLGHIFSTHHSLLFNKVIGTNIVYFKNDYKFLFNGDISFTMTDYFAQGSTGEEGNNTLISFGMMKFLDKKGLQTLRLDLSQSFEKPNDAPLRYNESSATLGYRIVLKKWWIHSFSPSANYKVRMYSFNDGTGKREDDQYGLAIDADKMISKKQRLNFKMSMLENESNKTSSHYKNAQVSLTYSLDL
jgi:hypothetical protein